jgi:hypothetical protein
MSWLSGGRSPSIRRYSVVFYLTSWRGRDDRECMSRIDLGTHLTPPLPGAVVRAKGPHQPQKKKRGEFRINRFPQPMPRAMEMSWAAWDPADLLSASS